MWIKKYFLIVAFVFPLLALAQPTDKVFFSVEEALENPLAVSRFYLDCSNGDDSLFFENIGRFANLTSLTVVGFDGTNFPEELFATRSLTSIAVAECLDLNYKAFLSKLSALNNLQQLTIDEGELLIVPSEITALPRLQKLVITNCDNLQIERSIDVLAGCKQLKYLGLPVNEICELPANIGKLSNLEILDISNNALMDIPESMVQMNNLNILYTTNNLFLNPVDELSKISPLQIRYLSVDSAISEEEQQAIKKLFPGASIGYSSPGDSLLDSESPDENPVYGEFTTTSGGSQILSEAYLHYARLFNYKSGFDSLLFAERYANPQYAYQSRNNSQARYTWNTMILYYWKHRNPELPKGTICFNFYPGPGKSYPGYINLFFREMTAFRGMYWVLDDDMSKRHFIRDFQKRKMLKRNPGEGWNDFRLYYDDINKRFTLEFKNINGMTRLNAYPLKENICAPELSREEYLKRYVRYSRLLDSRRKRFDNRLLRSRSSYNKSMKKLFETQWKSFSEVYFSDAEKKMTQAQWLLYYDRIIADESAAFEGAPVTAPLLERYLTINNYLQARNAAFLGFDTLSTPVAFDFVDVLGNKCVVREVFTLNTMQKIFYSTAGTLGFEAHLMGFKPTNDMLILVFLRNGQVGIVSPQSLLALDLSNITTVQTLQVKLFDSKLFTFGQLKSESRL